MKHNQPIILKYFNNLFPLEQLELLRELDKERYSRIRNDFNVISQYNGHYFILNNTTIVLNEALIDKNKKIF